MESVYDKDQLWHEHCTSPESPGQATETKYLLALIEIREAIEEGFGRLDQTSIEASMMLVGCKETFDSFVSDRLESDKLLRRLAMALIDKTEKIQPIEVESDESVDEPKKSAVTLDVGEIGKTVSESGIS